MIGITSIDSFHLTLEERFAYIKEAGFSSVLLWWGNGSESRRDRVLLAEKLNLLIENAHAITENLNDIWLDGESGEHIISELMQEIVDCSLYGIKTMVLHLSNGDCPPPVSKIGITRIESLITLAERLNVKLAFENVRMPQHIRYILDNYSTPYVGLCYDSGHENCWSPEINWLDLYSNRVFAVHLHDNNGGRDSHLIPFDGNIDWAEKAKAIAASSYTGAVTLEAEYHSSKVYESNSFETFLSRSWKNGRIISDMISGYRK